MICFMIEFPGSFRNIMFCNVIIHYRDTFIVCLHLLHTQSIVSHDYMRPQKKCKGLWASPKKAYKRRKKTPSYGEKRPHNEKKSPYGEKVPTR